MSSPAVRAKRIEEVALDELLERIEELGDEYGETLMADVEPWIEEARGPSRERASADELRRVRTALEDTLLAAAYREADALMAEHGAEIDALLSHAGLAGHRREDLAVVLIDPRTPELPVPFCARRWPLSVASRAELARELRDHAPTTAAALELPSSFFEHDIVVCTMGRVLRTRRRTARAGTT